MRFLTTLGVAATSLLLITSCSDSGDGSDDSGDASGESSAESSTSADSSDSKEPGKDKDGDGSDDAEESDESGESGDSDESGDSGVSEEKAEKKEAAARAEIRDAARAYSDAFLTGDSAVAFDLLSTRCQDEVRDSFGTTVLAAQVAYGKALRFESFEVEVSGDSASATYTYPKPELDKADETWVLEDIRWKLDDCPKGDS